MMGLCAYEQALALGNLPFAALLGLILICAVPFVLCHIHTTVHEFIMERVINMDKTYGMFEK